MKENVQCPPFRGEGLLHLDDFRPFVLSLSCSSALVLRWGKGCLCVGREARVRKKTSAVQACLTPRMKQPLRRSASATKRNLSAAEAGRRFPLTKLEISRRLPRRGGKKGGGKNAPPRTSALGPTGRWGTPGEPAISPGSPHPLPLGTTCPVSPHCLCLLQSFSSRSPHRLSFRPTSLATYSTTTKVEAQPTAALATPQAPRQPGGRAPPAVRRREGQEKAEGRGQGGSRSRRGCLLPLGGRLRVKQGRAGGGPLGGPSSASPPAVPETCRPGPEDALPSFPAGDLPVTRCPRGPSSTRSPSLRPGSSSPLHRGHRHAGLVWGRVTPSSSQA